MLRHIIIIVLLALMVSPAFAQDDSITVEVNGGWWDDSGFPVMNPGQFTVDIYFDFTNNFSGYTLPLRFYSPDGSIPNIIHRDEGFLLSTGSLYDYWDFNFPSFITDHQEFSWEGSLPDTVAMSCVNMSPTLPITEKTMIYRFNLRTSQIHDRKRTLCVDTTYVNITVDWLWNPPEPYWGGPTCWEIGNMPYLCGDCNSNGTINILDVTYLVNYLYKNGPEPYPPDAGDVNADFSVNVLDLTYYIRHLYLFGPPLLCPGEELP